MPWRWGWAIEVNTMPCRDLFAVERIMEGSQQLVQAALTFGWRVLGAASSRFRAWPALMSPKQRYQSLYRAMGRVAVVYGDRGDQVQVDVARPNGGHAQLRQLDGAGVDALCAMPIYGGRSARFAAEARARWR